MQNGSRLCGFKACFGNYKNWLLTRVFTETNPETESIIENFIEATNKYETLFLTCGLVCLWRMCYRDGTISAFSTEPDLVVFRALAYADGRIRPYAPHADANVVF